MVRMADGSAALAQDGTNELRQGRHARQTGEPLKQTPGDQHAHAAQNVNGVERTLSVIAGGALAAYALKRKDWTGLALGVAAGALVERGVSGHCAVYGALGLSSASEGRPVQLHGAAATVNAKKAQKVERAVTIFNHAPRELYAYWRQLENLPRIFQHLESVTEHDERHSRWVAKAPAGFSVEWEAEIINEVPGQLIAWKSLPGARVPNAGSVHFKEAPGGRGTEIHVSLEYEPPAGKLGVAVARLFGEEPDVQVREDLRRYKQLVETGELPVSENPGQGKRAKQAEFNAQVNAGKTGADLRDFQQRAPQEAHEPRHVPQPGDAERGINTTEPASWEAR